MKKNKAVKLVQKSEDNTRILVEIDAEELKAISKVGGSELGMQGVDNVEEASILFSKLFTCQGFC